MTPPARRPRPDPSFERLYRRHVAGVYRYALAVLHHPGEAEEVTRVTFAKAHRAYQEGERPRRARSWLIDIAHDLCRDRDGGSTGPPADADGEDGPGRQPPRAPLTCTEAQFASSRQLDGRLRRAERAALRAHLRECDECADLVRRQWADRRTFKTLAAIRPPPSLASLTSGTHGIARIGVVARAAAIAAAGLLAAGGAYAAFGRASSSTTEPRAHTVSPAKSAAPASGALEMQRERVSAPIAARAVRSRPRRTVETAKKPAASRARAARPKAHRSSRRHASKRPKSVHVHARAARPARTRGVASPHAARASVATPPQHVLHLTSKVSKPKK
jgi:DNA-directed RNA polymerase specialized sigma24 family protein